MLVASANSFRVLISLPHTSLGLRVVKNLPHPASPRTLATSPAVTSGAGCPSKSPLPALEVACWDHTLSSLFLDTEQSEPDDTSDQCLHTSAKGEERSLRCGSFLRDNRFSQVTRHTTALLSPSDLELVALLIGCLGFMIKYA